MESSAMALLFHFASMTIEDEVVTHLFSSDTSAFITIFFFKKKNHAQASIRAIRFSVKLKTVEHKHLRTQTGIHKTYMCSANVQ